MTTCAHPGCTYQIPRGRGRPPLRCPTHATKRAATLNAGRSQAWREVAALQERVARLEAIIAVNREESACA